MIHLARFDASSVAECGDRIPVDRAFDRRGHCLLQSRWIFTLDENALFQSPSGIPKFLFLGECPSEAVTEIAKVGLDVSGHFAGQSET